MSTTSVIIKTELWRFALPVLWFGLVAAISFIEAPLKFQAPGITIPLGLGIGRLVFIALNIVEAVLLIALTVLMFFPKQARAAKDRLWAWGALSAMFIFKIAVVRPPLNARTDLVLAGAEPGESPWHYIYIAAEVITMALLVIIALQSARAIVTIAKK